MAAGADTSATPGRRICGNGTLRMGAHVGGNVFADVAVAAGGATHQQTVFVGERHGQAVDLGARATYCRSISSGSNLSARSCQACTSSREKASARLVMGWGCCTRVNSLNGSAPTRWVGESGVDPIRVGCLDLFEFAHQGVILGVADLGIVEGCGSDSCDSGSGRARYGVGSQVRPTSPPPTLSRCRRHGGDK